MGDLFTSVKTRKSADIEQFGLETQSRTCSRSIFPQEIGTTIGWSLQASKDMLLDRNHLVAVLNLIQLLTVSSSTLCELLGLLTDTHSTDVTNGEPYTSVSEHHIGTCWSCECS